MGRTIIYVVLLGLLGFGVYYFIFRNSDSLYSEAEANFTIRDTAAIGKIFLVKNDGESILLERKEDGWAVNKQYMAMNRIVLNLLTCLAKQTPLYPVPDKDHNRIIQYLSGNATKVEVYDRKGNKIRVFYVGGQGPDYHGSYMLMDGATTPYLVEVPGFHGYLSPRFTTDIADWRARTIFNLTRDEISAVSVQYAGEPLSSFTIKKNGPKAEVSVDPQLSSLAKNLNQKRVDDYLGFFTNINCEGYLNGVLGMDTTIANADKRCSIEVTDVKGNKRLVDIYWMPLNKRSKILKDVNGGLVKTPYDVDRMYAVIHDVKDTALIQVRTFDKFFRRSYEFYQAEDTSKSSSVPMQRVPAPMLK